MRQHVYIILFYFVGISYQDSCVQEADKFRTYLNENKLLQYRLNSTNDHGDFEKCSCDEKCLRKCCAKGYSFAGSGLCVSDVNNDNRIKEYEEQNNLTNVFTYVPGINCTAFYYLFDSWNRQQTFIIADDGVMALPSDNIKIYQYEYCIDYFQGVGVVPLICFPPEPIYPPMLLTGMSKNSLP